MRENFWFQVITLTRLLDLFRIRVGITTTPKNKIRKKRSNVKGTDSSLPSIFSRESHPECTHTHTLTHTQTKDKSKWGIENKKNKRYLIGKNSSQDKTHKKIKQKKQHIMVRNAKQHQQKEKATVTSNHQGVGVPLPVQKTWLTPTQVSPPVVSTVK